MKQKMTTMTPYSEKSSRVRAGSFFPRKVPARTRGKLRK